MTLSVIIVSYNVRDYVRQCVDSLKRATFQGEVELILVDNHSTDGTVEMVRHRYPEVKVIVNPENRGFAPALNQGLTTATGDYLLSLNPDTMVEEKALQVLVDYLEAHPDVGCVGAKILNEDGTLQLAAKQGFPRPLTSLSHMLGLSRFFPKSRLFGRYNLTYLDSNETHTVDAVSGSCMCLPRRVVEKVGLMDEDFFMWCDDLDYCYRVQQSGYQVVYHGAAQIVHYKGVTHRTAPFYYKRLHFRSMARFARKYPELSGGPLMQLVIRLGLGLLWVASVIRDTLATVSSLIIDALIIVTAFFGMICMRFLPDPVFRTSEMLVLYAPVVAVYLALWLGVGGLFQIYGRYVLSYSRALVSSLVGFLLIATLTYLYREVAYSRLVLASASGLVAMLLPGWRLVAHLRRTTHKVGDSYRARRPSIFSRRAVILGTGSEGQRIARLLMRRPDTAIDLLGFIADNATPPTIQNPVLPVLGRSDDLPELATRHRFQEVIVASENFSNQELMTVLEQIRDLPLLFRIVPHEDEVMLGKANVEYIGDLPFVSVEATLYHRFHLLSKRTFDILASLVLLLLLLPVWLILLPITGLERHTIWTADGKQVSIRLLRRGSAALRRLPLLWYILKGGISFVGGEMIPGTEPDPRLIFKPGITGLAQLRHVADEPEVAQSYRHYYLQHQSLTFDLEILLKAVFRI